jgi:hypothetical protein
LYSVVCLILSFLNKSLSTDDFVIVSYNNVLHNKLSLCLFFHSLINFRVDFLQRTSLIPSIRLYYCLNECRANWKLLHIHCTRSLTFLISQLQSLYSILNSVKFILAEMGENLSDCLLIYYFDIFFSFLAQKVRS